MRVCVMCVRIQFLANIMLNIILINLIKQKTEWNEMEQKTESKLKLQ